MLTIDMLRHGETETDATCLYGATDVDLSDLGKQQLQEAFQAIQAEQPIEYIATSPLQRCMWLAQNIQSHHELPCMVQQGFTEMNFGDWEGQNTQQLIAQGIDFRHGITSLNPPNGEPFNQFSNRVIGAWQAYVDLHIQGGGHHVLITHGGVMRVLLGMVLNIPNQHLGKLYIPHATWSRITCVKGKPPVLWFMNREA